MYDNAYLIGYRYPKVIIIPGGNFFFYQIGRLNSFLYWKHVQK